MDEMCNVCDVHKLKWKKIDVEYQIEIKKQKQIQYKNANKYK